MVDRIASIGLATIRELWTDDPDAFPRSAHSDLVGGVATSERRKRDRAPTKGRNPVRYKVGARRLIFDNRVIVLVRATATQLASALDVIDDFADLRAPDVNSEFFTGLSPRNRPTGSTTWCVARLSDDDAPAACILDTGVNRGHPLLEHSLAVEDCHTCDPHGTSRP